VDNHTDVTYYPPRALDRPGFYETPAQAWRPGFTAVGEHNDELSLLGYRQVVLHFAACLRSGEPPAVTAADGYEAMRICRAIVDSRGKPVRLTEIA